MKLRHPIKSISTLLENELFRLSKEYGDQVGVIEPSIYTQSRDRMKLLSAADMYTQEVARLIDLGIRETVESTLTNLENKTRKTLDISTRLSLEVHIENHLQKKFHNLTLSERIFQSKRIISHLLFQEYQLQLSNLPANLTQVFVARGTTKSAVGHTHRILITEIFRAYHSTVQQFAKITGGKSIDFVFDKAQLERNELYQDLAEGGPYAVSELPDYPRPYASYVLNILY